MVLRSGQALIEAESLAYCTASLARYKIPR
jgi:hypothetical protein